MSRSRKALGAVAMAIAAAGGGLLIAAAAAVPAFAATAAVHAAPHGHRGSHVVARFTIRHAHRIGPSVIQPCAVHRPGMAPAYGDGGGCDTGTVFCDVTADEPTNLYSTRTGPLGDIEFDADVHCSEPVPEIRLGQDVIHSTPIDPNNPLTSTDVTHGINTAHTHNQAACQAGQYAVNASARIVPDDGDIVVGSLHDTSATVTFTAGDCGGGSGGGGGGGGGGGCATAAPSVSGHPAARHPDLITCGG